MINHPELQYLNILNTILCEGVKTPTRTGIDCFVYPHASMTFDLSRDGFPLFTHKKMATHTFKVELEGFIKGITDKKWYQEKKCTIWDEWCNPKKVPYSINPEIQKKMREENDLGKIYGYQWRNFNSSGYDQLKYVVTELKKNPYNRQLVCSAWNPLELSEMALPPCHMIWNVFATADGKLHLSWYQRSADFPLGVPANVMSYALLLHLLCLETGLKPGKVTGFFSNCHIYENQIDGVREALQRKLHPFPSVKTEPFTSIFSWEASHTTFINYICEPKINYPIAI